MPMMPGAPMGGAPDEQAAMMMAQGAPPGQMAPPASPFPSTDPQALLGIIAQFAGQDSMLFAQQLEAQMQQFTQAQQMAVTQAMQIIAQSMMAPPQAETMQGPAEAMLPPMG